MATRKTSSNARRDEPKSQAGKGGSLMTGLFIGLVIGLVAAAGLAWYFNDLMPSFQSADETQSARKQSNRQTAIETTAEGTSSPAAKAKPEVKIEAAPTPATEAPANTTKPRVDYTFYGILPGDKPAKQSLPTLPQPASKDIWWLQVAALKNPADADKLKARLTLLGLQVAMLKIETGGAVLYRIRTGPYKREDDALGDLDTLAANDFEPRLFKESGTPSSSR
ncbi:MAG: hypothetical protein B7Y41_11035 [Hydrogenophilales bacterium 28-61-23]|nr:MAG: hypothetical protein B7Y41_11035 [Hydrogenophilales bacterium 28-61-23]